jgi:peptide chain release factor 2
LKKSPVERVIYGGIFDCDKGFTELERVDARMATPGFWDNQVEAQKVIAEANRIKARILPVREFCSKSEELKIMLELVDESTGTEAEAYANELITQTRKLLEQVDTLELNAFLNDPMDSANAIVTVHAGAGGTESCDWANMLFRMYTRWADSQGYSVDIQDIADGEEAGISSATFRIVGPNAYGYVKAERGVHRLVRISPFDSNARRHTSFSSVDVIAEIADDLDADIDIPENELRVDTYRASGKGGQHVNRTDSAVRLTHIPTGLVVTCQNERSQIKNRATAMRTLKSRLYEKRLDEKRSEMERYYGEKGDIAWGNQIRSYVFQPYQMVKDLRTGVETGNVQAVMDGDLNPFIHAWLRAGGPKTRQAADDREFG